MSKQQLQALIINLLANIFNLYITIKYGVHYYDETHLESPFLLYIQLIVIIVAGLKTIWVVFDEGWEKLMSKVNLALIASLFLLELDDLFQLLPTNY